MKNEQIRKAGLKVTLSRLKVLELLEEHAEEHLSAEDVSRLLLENNVELGLPTIYRVLTQFEEAGLVKRHNFEGGQYLFELNHGAHHDHILCLDCGRLEEFVDEVIEKRQHAIARDKGFRLEEHALILYAHCTRSPCPYRQQEEDA